MKTKRTIEETLNGWKSDPRMVFLSMPGRDLTKKEREEWERNIQKYQIYSHL